MSGFYLLHRGWQDHPVFRNETFSKRDAFVWLIEEAAYRTTRVFAGSNQITLERGQLSHSLRFMAKAWKWDEAKVRRFLSSLSNAKIIDAAADAGQTVITICNYDKYQALEKSGDAAGDAPATQRRRGGDAKKNEGNEVSKETPPNPPAGGRRGKTRFPEDWVLPAVSDLPPKAKACAEQWTPESYETHGEAYAAYWRGNGKMMVDWVATWCNRIIALHSQVMRDQKFGNAPTGTPGPAVPMNDNDWNAYCDRCAERARQMNRQDEAAEWIAKKRLNGSHREGSRKPQAIGDLVGRMAMGAHH